ncbi:hypothetical protein CDAR_12722, partial [Caerostris darwini]
SNSSETFNRRRAKGTSSKADTEICSWRNAKGASLLRDVVVSWNDTDDVDSTPHCKGYNWRNKKTADTTTNVDGNNWRCPKGPNPTKGVAGHNWRYEEGPNPTKGVAGHNWRYEEATDTKNGVEKLNSGRGQSLNTASHDEGHNWRNQRTDNTTADGIGHNRRYAKGLGIKKTEINQPRQLGGYWGIICGPDERNSEGLTVRDVALSVFKELHNKERNLFNSPPSILQLEDNISIMCYTSDSSDEGVLISAKTIRKHFFYPCIMYYFPHTNGRKREAVYFHTPNGELYKRGFTENWVLINFE